MLHTFMEIIIHLIAGKPTNACIQVQFHTKNNLSSLLTLPYKAGVCICHHTKNNWNSLLILHTRLVHVFITLK